MSVNDQRAAELEQLFRDIRPELHRYCARMTGSAIDGEDVVQDTLVKAWDVLPGSVDIDNPRNWLFRVAHNKAVDYTRRYASRFGEPLDDHAELALEAIPLEATEIARMSLSLYMELTPVQRGTVILADVLGHSLAEIAMILETTLAAVKGALHRGRASLRKLAPGFHTPRTPADRRTLGLLNRYVEYFVARDFDALRAMLARDVRLSVMGVARAEGAKEAGGYFHRYSRLKDLWARSGLVEGWPAMIVFDDSDGAVAPVYFVLIDFAGEEIAEIRDYRYTRYALAETDWSILEKSDHSEGFGG